VTDLTFTYALYRTTTTINCCYCYYHHYYYHYLTGGYGILEFNIPLDTV